MTRLSFAQIALLTGLCAFTCAERAAAADASDPQRGAGVLYTMSNAASGNAVIMFARAPTGELKALGATPTGGLGTGAGLGNAGGVALSDDGRWLFVVNAGSNDFTIFETDGLGRLVARGRAPSNGLTPVSIAVDDDLIYVLNAGSDSIAGFRLTGDGAATPLAGSVRALSATNVGAAQIAFSPDGSSLVVTEKTTSRIDVYGLGANGLPTTPAPKVFASPAVTPFGFTFDRRHMLLVTATAGGAPNGSLVSSYHLAKDGTLSVIQASAPTKQSAACWVVSTPGARYAYTADAASGVISGFSIAPNGVLTLLNQSGVAANPGPSSHPIDMGIGGDGRFLYTLNTGAQTIGAYSIGADGALTPIATPYGGLPVTADGLAVR